MPDHLLKNLKKIKLAGRQDRKKILQADPYAEKPDYQRFNEIELKKQGASPLLVVCGVENYRALQTFRRDLRRHTAVVAEPDTAKIRNLLTNENMVPFVKNNNILFVVGEAVDYLGDEIEAYFSVAAVDNIFSVPPLDNRGPEFESALKNLANFQKTARTNLATMEKFLLEWHCFFAHNLKDYLQAPALSELKNNLENQDCTLVGPGADIDDRLELLKRSAQGWLVALDTALPVLNRLNITPDYVICVDSGDANLGYLDDFPEKSTLITPPYMDPRALETAAKFRFFEPNFPPAQWLRPQFPSPGFLAMSGSVSITALDFIGLLNPRRCLLLGVDLCYKNNLPFSRLSPLYSKMVDNLNRFQSLPGQIIKYMSRYELKQLPGKDKTILTTARFLNWKKSLEFLINQVPFPVYRPQNGILNLNGTVPLQESEFNFTKNANSHTKNDKRKIDWDELIERLQTLYAEINACESELHLVQRLKQRGQQINSSWLRFVREIISREELLQYFQWEVDRLTREMQDLRPDEQTDVFEHQFERWKKLISATGQGIKNSLEAIRARS